MKKQIKKRVSKKVSLKSKKVLHKEVKGHIREVNKKMLISEVMSINPEKYYEMSKIMFENGLHCFGCGVAAYETLEQGCLVHGMTKKQIDDLVIKLNKILKS
ncbi:MAG: DUF1858 domain-containing protein [Candidatus Pacearchaeota archaeon]|jgi:hybrid cluster-associated redox disulfide protein